MTDEIFKPYPQNLKYQVSNLGRVKGIRKEFLSLARMESGHLAINIRVGDCKTSLTLVHRMVLETFVGPCPDGLEACHGDGSPDNNSLDNLRWDTRLANKEDAKKHGAIARGERTNTAKLTDEKVREIRKRYADGGITLEELANHYNVTDGNIHCIVSLKTWRHIK